MQYFDGVQFIHNAIEKLRAFKPIASVPPVLKDEFDQLRLKNTVLRLKLICILLFFSKFLQLVPVFFLDNNNIQLLKIAEIFDCIDYFDFAVIIAFPLLAGCFSYKQKHILWFICYLFVLYNAIVSLLIIQSHMGIQAAVAVIDEGSRWSEANFVELFFLYVVLLLVLPDFKPSIFIPFSALYCIASLIAISGGFQSLFLFSIDKIFTINNFNGVLIAKILLYNRKVRTFIYEFQITNLNKKLEALSITDELTKLNNRRSLLDYMDIVWKQSCRLQLPITAIMIDIDYFKKYNDSLGHLEGDKALVAVAQCLKNSIKRETDFVARFGGEEFVCLLPYIEKTDAVSFANELVRSIEDMKVPHPMSEHSQYITVSAGIASIVPDEHSSQAQLLDEADRALYMAKQSGRNRAVIN